MKKIRTDGYCPERTCVCCRKKGVKELFYRIVRNKDGEIGLDRSGKAEGRGAYVCKDEKCIQLLCKKRGLERAFRCKIEDKVYDELLKEFD